MMRLSKDAERKGFQLVEREEGDHFLLCVCGGRMLPKEEMRRRDPLAGDIFVCERCEPTPKLAFSKAKVFSVLEFPKQSMTGNAPEPPQDEGGQYVIWTLDTNHAVVLKYEDGNEPTATYEIEYGKCSCPSFKFQKSCKHVEMTVGIQLKGSSVSPEVAREIRLELREKWRGMVDGLRMKDTHEEDGQVTEMVLIGRPTQPLIPQLPNARRLAGFIRGLRVVVELEGHGEAAA